MRGATVVPDNTESSIVTSCAELFRAMTEANGIAPGEIAAIVFTATPDLGAAFPAQAARIAGFEQVPRICAQEIDVPGALGHCLRILLLWNTERPADSIEHCYRNGAEALTMRDEQAPSILDGLMPQFPAE
ncbi:MAG: chorismate mutase [Planctomycetota bacterium]|nr:chorismate mutase [Planctomycetota bacterium]